MPIVLGVVGHRDVHDEDDRRVLKERLVDSSRSLTNAYQWTPPGRPVITRGGAERDRGRCAALDERLGGRVFVRVPLPFDKGPYLKSTSFDSGPAKDKFEQLINDPRVESLLCHCRRKSSRRNLTGNSWRPSERRAGKGVAIRMLRERRRLPRTALSCVDRIMVGMDRRVAQPRSVGNRGARGVQAQGRPPKHYPWNRCRAVGFPGRARLG